MYIVGNNSLQLLLVRMVRGKAGYLGWVQRFTLFVTRLTVVPVRQDGWWMRIEVRGNARHSNTV